MRDVNDCMKISQEYWRHDSQRFTDMERFKNMLNYTLYPGKDLSRRCILYRQAQLNTFNICIFYIILGRHHLQDLGTAGRILLKC
jgi:hypothetical protein